MTICELHFAWLATGYRATELSKRWVERALLSESLRALLAEDDCAVILSNALIIEGRYLALLIFGHGRHSFASSSSRFFSTLELSTI